MAKNSRRPTVMVVEDESLLLRAITKKLDVSGVDSVSCLTGKQAFDYLESLPELPDAIWLDYYLKDMNGIDFMGRLKGKKKWAEIPVIVVSNSANPQKVSGMLAFGVKKYYLKAEHRLDTLIKTVKEIIDEKEK